MKYLLDTHTLLWAIMESTNLSKQAIKVLQDVKTDVYVSAISFWEISLKYGLGKLDLRGISPEDLPVICETMEFKILPLAPEICATYHQLDQTYHRDPFDKMIIWQAMQGQYTLISKDKNINKYQSVGLNICW